MVDGIGTEKTMAVTANKNFLSPTGFKFKLDATKYPNLEYFCSGVNLPGIGMGAVEQPYRGVNLGFTGDRLTFEDLTITFNVSEDMDNYLETFNWMDKILRTEETEVSDATLTILTSHNNAGKTIKFKDCFPTALSGFEFTTTSTEVEYLQASVTFKYTTFEFI